jgi:hypothetical protein
MARRKIRHSGPFAYSLNPEEVLALPSANVVGLKPRIGTGSGRAGGARSVTHRIDHLKRVYPGTTVMECPICKYGIKIWNLWNEAKYDTKDAWLMYWEGRDEARRDCEYVLGLYEAHSQLQGFWRIFDGSEYQKGSFVYEQRRQSSLYGRETSMEDVEI